MFLDFFNTTSLGSASNKSINVHEVWAGDKIRNKWDVEELLKMQNSVTVSDTFTKARRNRLEKVDVQESQKR